MFGGDAASVILILTDGFINDLPTAVDQVCTMGYIYIALYLLTIMMNTVVTNRNINTCIAVIYCLP